MPGVSSRCLEAIAVHGRANRCRGNPGWHYWRTVFALSLRWQPPSGRAHAPNIALCRARDAQRLEGRVVQRDGVAPERMAGGEQPLAQVPAELLERRPARTRDLLRVLRAQLRVGRACGEDVRAPRHVVWLVDEVRPRRDQVAIELHAQARL